MSDDYHNNAYAQPQQRIADPGWTAQDASRQLPLPAQLAASGSDHHNGPHYQTRQAANGLHSQVDVARRGSMAGSREESNLRSYEGDMIDGPVEWNDYHVDE